MYFAIEPKTTKKDLFNFDNEYRELKKAVVDPGDKLIVISGLRRTGKTSLMKVVYNETALPKIYIDTREIFPLTPQSVNQHFVSALFELAKRYNLAEALLDQVKSLELGVKIELKQREHLLSSVLKSINLEMGKRKTQAVIFIDEAQKLKPTGIDDVFAYVYDNLPNVKIVLAGSEIGLLEDFLGREKDAPLFGRAKKLITLNRFSRENSIAFLQGGFKQADKEITTEEIENVVGEIDGLAGWLSMYGWYRLKTTREKALKTVKVEGSKIVAGELEAFLKGRQEARKRYLVILKGLSVKQMKWSEVKTYLEIEFKSTINDSHILNYVDNLVDYGFIEKRDNLYELTDPLVRDALPLVSIKT